MKDRIEIPLFTEHYSNRLYTRLEDKSNLKSYHQSKFEYEDKYLLKGSGIYMDPEFKLDAASGILTNAINLYEQLSLNNTQASDKRLWTYMTHVYFWDFMQAVHPVDLKKSSKKISDFIKDRYFMNTLNIRTLTHNGISRLWWYVHLTIDNEREDKYELTKVLLSLQDIPVSLLERALGSNSRVRRSVLEFLSKNPEVKTSKKVQQLLRLVNLSGGVKNLPMMEHEELMDELNKLKTALV